MENNKQGKKKKKKSFSNIKILAGSLAAISASLITAKLTSYVGSVVIVGISSILLTVLAKIYEHIIKKSKKIAAKATYHLPYGKILPDSISDNISSHLIHAMQDDDTTDIDIDIKSIQEKEVTVADGDTTTPDDIATAKPKPESRTKRIWEALLPTTPLTKAVTLFCAMAVLTTGISWGITTVFDRPDVTNVTVKEQKVQQLSDAEKDAIKRAAAQEVANQIAEAQSDANTANNTNSALSKKISSLETTITSLQSQVNTLKSSSTADPSSSADKDNVNEQSINDINTKITTLNSQVEDLKNQVNALKDTGNESKGSSSSSTSGATE